jgi:hypothetical protein
MKIQEKREMVKKQKSRYRILWYILPVLATLIISVIVVPPMIHLNFLKPKIQNAIFSKTGIPVDILGNINVSLLGKATIVAHNITVPNGVIGSCEFSIPFFDIFDVQNAKISENIIINNGSWLVTKIEPFDINADITVNNSKIKFLNKEYKIINARFSKNKTDAIVRTDQHKYEIKARNNKFIISNNNNNLELIGELLPNGSAIAHLNITAQDINRWFEFDIPRITGRFPIDADIRWNGSYGLDFYNISANGVTGNITLQEDGYKIIDLKSNNADYDMSFLAKHPEILKSTAFDLDFYGKLRFMDKTFKHVKIKTVGSDQEIKIENIIADDLNINGGIIDETGAHNVNVTLPENGINTTCLFDGTPIKWSCKEFSYGDLLTGEIDVNKNGFIADIKSTQKIPEIKTIINSSKSLGNTGIIRFDFPDMSGILNITKSGYTVSYEHIDNKSLNEVKINLDFLPKYMSEEKGNFIWNKDLMLFIPDSKTWQLSTENDSFILRGDNFKDWFKNSDLQSLNDLQYKISGNYKNGNISNLTLEIAEHKFVGSVSKNSVTLNTDLLNIDYFISPYFKENFEELSFFTQLPIIIPFDIDTNVALSAKTMIYNNQRYNNFVYSLHKNVQNFSITDSDRGNLLATINKDNAKYDINIQLNKFMINNKLLPSYATLNIGDTNMTAEINLKTMGKIAHDIINNLNGTFDILFDGGNLYGLGFDEFYASAQKITTLNAESYLSYALGGGVTRIKDMHIVGSYDKGDIKTLQPLTLSMKHVDASGGLEITDKNMFVKLNLLLRGTSAGPEPITLTIDSNNYRDFSLSEIMISFDPEFMRTFVQTHDKF